MGTKIDQAVTYSESGPGEDNASGFESLSSEDTLNPEEPSSTSSKRTSSLQSNDVNLNTAQDEKNLTQAKEVLSEVHTSICLTVNAL